MIINIYINWEERKVYNEEEYLEVVTEEVEKNLDEWGEEWLCIHYTNWGLFNLQDSEKAEIEQKMKDELVRYTFNYHIAYDYNIVRIEI